MVAAASTSQISQPLWMGGGSNLGAAVNGGNPCTGCVRVLLHIALLRVTKETRVTVRHKPASPGQPDPRRKQAMDSLPSAVSGPAAGTPVQGGAALGGKGQPGQDAQGHHWQPGQEDEEPLFSHYRHEFPQIGAGPEVQGSG